MSLGIVGSILYTPVDVEKCLPDMTLPLSFCLSWNSIKWFTSFLASTLECIETRRGNMFGLFVCEGSGWFYFETMRVGSNTCSLVELKRCSLRTVHQGLFRLALPKCQFVALRCLLRLFFYKAVPDVLRFWRGKWKLFWDLFFYLISLYHYECLFIAGYYWSFSQGQG